MNTLTIADLIQTARGQYAIITDFPRSLGIDDFNALLDADLVLGTVERNQTGAFGLRRFKRWYGFTPNWHLLKVALIDARRSRNMRVSFDWGSCLQITQENTLAEIRSVGTEAYLAYKTKEAQP